MQFDPIENLITKERTERETIKPNSLCTFGVDVLDRALKCIFPDDLIIIGADAGMGKSTLAIDIALHNAKNGKIVALFFLEGGHNEAVRRIKWRMMCDEYYGNLDRYDHIDMDYVKWRMNSLPDKIKPIEDLIDNTIKGMFNRTFFVYNITPDGFSEKTRVSYENIYRGLVDFFNGEEFGEIRFDLDLLLIDHLHYFDFEDSTRMNEAEKLSKAMRMCKEISDLHRIPTIVISHLRKKTKDRGLPGQEDLHGSSNIPKIATDVIILAPYYNEQDSHRLVYPTFFRFVKSRRGLKDNYAVLCNFNFKENKYESNFKVYPVGKNGDVTNNEITQLPKWAQDKPREHKEINFDCDKNQ